LIHCRSSKGSLVPGTVSSSPASILSSSSISAGAGPMFDVSENGSAEGRAHLQLRRLFTPEPRRFGHRPKSPCPGRRDLCRPRRQGRSRSCRDRREWLVVRRPTPATRVQKSRSILCERRLRKHGFLDSIGTDCISVAALTCRAGCLQVHTPFLGSRGEGARLDSGGGYSAWPMNREDGTGGLCCSLDLPAGGRRPR
jgi:hypothetical protein